MVTVKENFDKALPISMDTILNRANTYPRPMMQKRGNATKKFCKNIFFHNERRLTLVTLQILYR